MTLRLAAGLALAVLSACALNWGLFVQHGSAAEAPPLSLRRPVHSLLVLFSNVRWVVGFAAGIGGWALYVVALGLAPLSLVQATSAGGIGVLAALSHRSARLGARERLGVAAALAGLVFLGASLGAHHVGGSPGRDAAVFAWIGVSIAIAALVATTSRAVLPRAGALGIAAGLLYASGDVATKAVLSGHGWGLVPVLLACHAAGFVALQLGFQRGGALATAGVASALTNSVPIAAGLAVYHEHVPAGIAGIVRVAGFLATVVGAIMLARSPGVPHPGAGHENAAASASRAENAPAMR